MRPTAAAITAAISAEAICADRPKRVPYGIHNSDKMKNTDIFVVCTHYRP
jgi:hypothetical protein